MKPSLTSLWLIVLYSVMSTQWLDSAWESAKAHQWGQAVLFVGVWVVVSYPFWRYVWVPVEERVASTQVVS